MEINYEILAKFWSDRYNEIRLAANRISRESTRKGRGKIVPSSSADNYTELIKEHDDLIARALCSLCFPGNESDANNAM